MEDKLKPSVSRTILECIDTSSNKQLETVITEKDMGQHNDTDNFCTKSCQRLLARTDSILEKYTSWASSYYNTDKGIKLFAYLTWLLSRLATPKSSSSSTSCNRIASNDDLATGLRKIYSEMMMVRYALRLFGLPMSLEAVRTGSWYSGWKDRYIVLLGKIMSWTMVFYYPYEHAAYFHWIAPKLVKADAERCTAISCRFWLAYVCADLVSSVLKIKELILRRNDLQNSLSENEVSFTHSTSS